MTNHRRLWLPKLFILLCLVFGAPACATILPMLPKLVAVVTDAMATLTIIDGAVDQWIDQHPNVDPKLRAKYEAAYARCVAALNAANHALAGAEKLDQQDIDAAFAEFRAAYLAMRDLLVMEGVAVAGPQDELSVGVATGAIVLPVPEALTYRLAP
jgi:hypothetical protein